MIESDIWDAFSQQVTTFAAGASPPVPVIHQGVHGEPPAEGAWLETRFFPNRTENYGLSDSGPSAHRGFCQVTACERPGRGILSGLELANAVVSAFPKGTLLGSARVNVKPWISSVIVMGDRIIHPVTVRYELIT